ncbi:MAG: hypothetical protein EOR12_27050 [Mesorhizobium sp.]|uniref:hypothetical protein n=1 Tax=Mesorhizobium sp. TaxID=1871066 RepID=UPI000FE624E2|nr:hypothetical protein [Mesorhizobium sp.]RWP84892.1 MAG: hypothetical protein EOR12_27050 [Mesorhizobium sp.]
MDPLEKAVRDAAVKLRDAIKAATDAGYRVDMPRHTAQLEAIAISSTAKNMKPTDKPAEKAGKEPAAKKS